jgi:hypothetical protein
MTLTWPRTLRLYREYLLTAKVKAPRARLRAARDFSLFARRRGNDFPDEVTLENLVAFDRHVSERREKTLEEAARFVEFVVRLVGERAKR